MDSLVPVKDNNNEIGAYHKIDW